MASTLSTDKAGDPVAHGGHGMGTGNMEESVTNLEELKARWASKEGGSAQFHQPLLNPLQNPVGWCVHSQCGGSPARAYMLCVFSWLACSVHAPCRTLPRRILRTGLAKGHLNKSPQLQQSTADDSLLQCFALPAIFPHHPAC